MTNFQLCCLMRPDGVVPRSLLVLQVMQLQQLYRNPCRVRCKCFDICLAFVLLTHTMQIIFCLNSMLAWIMQSQIAVDLLEKWSAGYIKMDCKGNKCYGVLAVRTTFLSRWLFVLEVRDIHCDIRCTGCALRLQSSTLSWRYR